MASFVLDTSAIVSCVLGEPSAPVIFQILESAISVAVSSPILLEAEIVLLSRGAGGHLAKFIDALRPTEIPFGPAHRQVALEAFQRYGKGRHPAGLNFGDCMSYAVAKVAGHPLLFVGDDFKQTDLLCVRA